MGRPDLLINGRRPAPLRREISLASTRAGGRPIRTAAIEHPIGAYAGTALRAG